MALGVTDLKKGQVFQLDGVPYRVLSYAQKVMGRGGSIVNVKIKSLVDGRVLDKTFKGNERFEPAEIANQKLRYLYKDHQSLYLMSDESYEQYEISVDDLDNQLSFIKENDTVQAQLFNGKLINIELPKKMPLKVTYTEDAVKGDTTSAVLKDATLETGAKLKLPAFIKIGDTVLVDTDSGEYKGRV